MRIVFIMVWFLNQRENMLLLNIIPPPPLWFDGTFHFVSYFHLSFSFLLNLSLSQNQSPQPGEGSCATLRRYHEASAESRTHPHRRY